MQLLHGPSPRSEMMAVQTKHLMDTKPEMRRAALARRAGLARDDARAPEKLASVALPFLDGRPHEISTYFASGSELDPGPLAETLASAGHRLSLPVVTGPARALLFRQWQAGDPLEKGAMNIPAPLANAPAVTPHILLVPLLAVDRAGYRLGYGGGYYDRTLHLLRQSNTGALPIAVGVCYSGQIMSQVPRQPHDQPLDWIITPEGAMPVRTTTASHP